MSDTMLPKPLSDGGDPSSSGHQSNSRNQSSSGDPDYCGDPSKSTDSSTIGDPSKSGHPILALRNKWMEKMESLKASIVSSPSPSKQKVYALDCEMVAVRIPGNLKNTHKAAHVCVVSNNGQVVYRCYISQKYPIVSCMTWISGIRWKDLKGAPSLEQVQTELYAILRGNILVGHSLNGDLQSLEMQHPIFDQRDTQKFFMRNLPYGERQTNLNLMTHVHLGLEIQKSCHNPIEDALATMALYLLYKDQVDAQGGYVD